MLNPEVCAELRDTHGPYATEKQCIERAVELSRKLDVVFTVPQTYSYKCVKGNES
jgi:hypothetical protein